MAEPSDDQIRAEYARTGSIRATAANLGCTYNRVDRLAVRSAPPDPGLAALVEAAVARAMGSSGVPAPAPAVAVVPAEPVAIPIAPPGRSNVVTIDRPYERIAVLSDLHHPFEDKAAIRATLAALRDYRPELIVINGDGFDCFSISDHDREPGRADCLQDEFDTAQPTWKEIDAFGVDTIFIEGNHEERIARLQRKTPGLFRLRSLDLAVAAELPRRWRAFRDQTRLKIGSLSILHGNLKGRGNATMHCAAGMLKKLRTSCLFGHHHRFQTFLETTADGTYRAGYASGHLCDTAQAHYITDPDWQQGFSTIDFDWSVGVFSVTPHLIVRGKARLAGRTYG